MFLFLCWDFSNHGNVTSQVTFTSVPHSRKAISSSASIIFLRKKKSRAFNFCRFFLTIFRNCEGMCWKMCKVGLWVMLNEGRRLTHTVLFLSCIYDWNSTQIKRHFFGGGSNNKSKTSIMAYNFVSKLAFYVFDYIISIINLLKHKFW